MGYSQFKIFPIAKDQKASLIFDEINKWLLTSECRVQFINTMEVNKEKIIVVHFETSSRSTLETILVEQKKKSLQEKRDQYDKDHNKT